MSALVLVLSAGAAPAQLRPLDPLDWKALDGRDGGVDVAVGTAIYLDQRASLAGTVGRLLEVGSVRGTWVDDRVAIEIAGTAVRFFQDQTVFADPLGETRAFNDHVRVDAGDYRVSTLLLLTPAAGSLDVALRFGVRLPTTDNRAGLERDQTDFFATVGGRYRSGRITLSGEGGMGVLGTRNATHEQVDPILFAAGLAWDLGLFRSELELVGQHDTRPNAEFRGNENLGEVRLVVRRGERRWLRAGLTRGWETFSPSLGVLVEAGVHH